MIQNVTSRMGGMEVRSTRMIQPNHLWIGIRETN